jgi:hypothetical protein
MFDLRVPAGVFFLMIGLILSLMGVAAPGHAPLLEINLNLYGGVCFVLFSGVLLWLAKRQRV